jgi:serine/threonine protein kinase/formylglycine-generating enzyme required for sulfatase activity
MIGQTISHYRILEKLGEGGMGVVYKAEDVKLKRTVALKFLPPDLTRNPEAKQRFIHEAQAASALEHSNICTIHEIDETEDGRVFTVMACYEGETLRGRIERGALDIDESIDIAIQAARGLSKAHDNGIVHRDIKPANIMITRDGVVKILDFGLAKLTGQTRLTRDGSTLGTAAYMSPEHARGQEVDLRADIWSLGVVFYEMVTGQLPFKGEFEQAAIYSILNEQPESPRTLREGISPRLEATMLTALEKERDSRFGSMEELSEALSAQRCVIAPPSAKSATWRSPWRHVRKAKVVVPAVLFPLVLIIASLQLLQRGQKTKWARDYAVPEVMRLIEDENYVSAFQLARLAQDHIQSDPILQKLWPEMTRRVSIQSSPSGADVYMKEYRALEQHWQYLGPTPLDSIAIPIGFFRWRVEKAGCETVEAAASGSFGALQFVLDESGSVPPGMVRVPAGEYAPAVNFLGFLPPVELPEYLIDKHEVTNREFKEFVDSGGYSQDAYWKYQFFRDDTLLSWDKAMALFLDATGRPGPSTWVVGSYPDGRDDYPVDGISWYEAAAYAEFAGKQLPTIYHWIIAAGLRFGSHIVPWSNFDARGPASVETYNGVGPYGTYDMAGNVREWCRNESEEKRYILGGAWDDAIYMFHTPYAKPPFDRSPGNGFRCIRELKPDEVSEEVARPFLLPHARDFENKKPVNEKLFDLYRNLYAYDKTDLAPVIEFTDTTAKDWTAERVTFNAAYGNERMVLYLFLPKSTPPPFQTIIYFPGDWALYAEPGEEPALGGNAFLLKSGRAVCYPVYRGTFERRDGFNLVPPNITQNSFRDHAIMWMKDISRSIDYLDIREDIDGERLAYRGFSLGAVVGPVPCALEKRIKVGVLALGGFPNSPIEMNVPECDPLNFAPRVLIPILMLNGRFDYLFPLESSQRPLFRLLGTPEEHKRHVLYETGHSLPKNESIKETLDWLDRYLGPVG